MSFSGPSIIGNNTAAAVITALTITDYLHVLSTNNTAKFSVADNGGLDLINVDTVNDIVTLGGSVAITGLTHNKLIGINNVGVLDISDNITPLALANLTLTGTTTITGPINISSSFIIYNSTPAAIFEVNGATNATTTFHNTLDDGSGNSTWNGTMNLGTTMNLRTPLVFSSGAGTALSISNTTLAVGTKNNTLDDGSGNSTWLGTLSLNNDVGLIGAVDSHVSQTGLRIYNSSSPGYGDLYICPVKLSAFTAEVIYDAPGSAGVTAGHLFKQGVTINANLLVTTGGAVITGLTQLVGNVQCGVTGNTLVTNESVQSVITKNNTLDDGTGNMVVAKIMESHGLISLIPGPLLAFTVSATTGVVNTLNNTLDDSTGNMTVNGSTHVIGVNQVNKFEVVNNTSGAAFNVNTNTNAVTTLNNTLDDGSGNMTMDGELLVNGIADTNKVRVVNGATTAFHVDTNLNATYTTNSTLDNGNGDMILGRYLTIGNFEHGTPGVHTTPWLMGTYSTSTAVIIPFDPFSVNNPIVSSNIYRVDIHIPTLTQTGATPQRLWARLLTSCTVPTAVTTSTYDGYGLFCTSSGSGSVGFQGTSNLAEWQILPEALTSAGGVGINLSLTWNPSFVATTTYSRVNMLSEVYGFDGSNNVKASMANLITDAAGTNLPNVCGIEIFPAGSGFAFSIPTYASVYITPFRA